MFADKSLSTAAADSLLVGQTDPAGASRRRWHFTFKNDVALIASVAALWSLLYNIAFWRHTFAAMWHPTLSGCVFAAAVAMLVFTLHASLLLLVPARALRAVTSTLFIVAALSAYFCSTYGVVLNKDMIRNALQTDAAEASGLLSPGLVVHLLLLGVLPALLMQRVFWPRRNWRVTLRRRAVFAASVWAVSICGLFAAAPSYAVFFREHKPLRYMLVPAAPLASAFSLLRSELSHPQTGPLLDPAGKAQVVAARTARPRVIFMVVGETARAGNFSLGGYARQTNPELQAVAKLTYFDHARSCGTATAISVPCMFSGFPRDRFEVGEADRYVNLLDSLAAAGVTIEWRDNNAGCKGVCARVPLITYAGRSDPQLCPQSYCYDAVMLRDLEQRLQHIDRDTVIVFHQIGSHGPAYSERYPPSFERFTPACHSHELQRCSAEEVRNAYDNTIAYTDWVLARQIQLLQAASHLDAMLIYASDHGESLGELGVYLHGMPYAFAPREQTSVPLLVWTSEPMRARLALDTGCLQQHRHDPVSHDNLYHTLLGAMGLSNRIYDRRLDLLAGCRTGAGVDRI